MALWKIEEAGDWTRFRSLSPAVEVDFHREGRDDPPQPYEQRMWDVRGEALRALKRAHQLGLGYVIFTHGASTSGPGQTTARSMVRGLMKSPDATPYVDRRSSIQHYSVFVAALKANPEAPPLPERPACPSCGSTETKQATPAGHFRCERGHLFNWLELAIDSTDEPQ